MLPRGRRLRTARDFQALGRNSRTARSPHLTIRTKLGRGTSHRFGFIVGKRVSKLAVRRNQLKRRLRHIVSTLDVQPPALDIIIIAQPGSVNATYAELEQQLKQLLLSRHAPRSH